MGTSGSELLRLIRDGRLEWRAELAQADLLRVGEGAAVFVQSPVGGEVPGQVRRVSPAFWNQWNALFSATSTPAEPLSA